MLRCVRVYPSPAAHAFKPDLLLLDLVRPKMNGYDVCRAIRKLLASALVT
jgi:DNA-binding response OmpR family regulator